MTPRKISLLIRDEDKAKTLVAMLPNVRLAYVNPMMGHAIDVARAVWESMGYKLLVITHFNDGKHSRGSLHPLGCAMDLRTMNVREEHWAKIRNLLAKRLGVEYDVILEGDHIHIEWQPKETKG